MCGRLSFIAERILTACCDFSPDLFAWILPDAACSLFDRAKYSGSVGGVAEPHRGLFFEGLDGFSQPQPKVVFKLSPSQHLCLLLFHNPISALL